MAIDNQTLQNAIIAKGLIDEKSLSSLVKNANTYNIPLEDMIINRELI